MSSESKKPDPKQGVLHGAMVYFATHGFSRANLADLEEALGIGRRSLYETFGDKRQLYGQSLKHYRGTVFRDLLGKVRARPEPTEAVEEAIRHFSSGGETGGSLIRHTLTDFKGREPAMVHEAQSMVDELRDVFRRKLEEAHDPSGLSGGNLPSRPLAGSITLGLLGLCLVQDTAQAETMARDARDAVLAIL